MFETLYAYDVAALKVINVDWGSPELDQFWLTISHLDREAWFIYGLLPVMLLYLLYIYRLQALKPLLMVTLALGITDAFSYRVIKVKVNRPRPFMNVELSGWLRKVDEAHGPSFPSNHAANNFAGATILAWYFRSKRKYFYTFALLVALSRPALGVHYPSDVIAGAILGICVGGLIRNYVLNLHPWFSLPEGVSLPAGNSG